MSHLEDLQKMKNKFLEDHGIIWNQEKKAYTLGNLELTWEEVKQHQSEWNRKLGLNFLQAFFSFRKRFVDAMIRYLQEKYHCYRAGHRRCTHFAVGSTNLTSDYDITVTGPDSPLIVEEFNDLFINLWKVNSAVLFDTNLYGNTYFYQRQLNYQIMGLSERDVGGTKVTYTINTSNHKETVEDQHVWALTKIQVHLEDDSLLREYLGKQWSGSYRKWWNSALGKVNSLKAPTSLNKNSKEYLDYMNDQYELFLKEIERNRRIFEENPYSLELARSLKESIATSNFYANEAYYTEGALAHVVGHLQKLIPDYPVTRDMYLDSLLENFGDFIKVHIQTEGDAVDLLTEGSKYLARVANAQHHLKGESGLGKVTYDLLNLIKNQIRTSLYQKEVLKSQLSQLKGQDPELDSDIDRTLRIIDQGLPEEIKNQLFLIVMIHLGMDLSEDSAELEEIKDTDTFVRLIFQKMIRPVL